MLKYECFRVRKPISVFLGIGLLFWLGFLLFRPAGLLAQPEPTDSTITLTKTVEVYTFEDLTFTIDSYTVAHGDNLAGILKQRGLWPSVPNANREAQLIRLVKQLNPAIANPDLIAPGQDLYLPAPRVAEPEKAPEPPPLPVEDDLPPGAVSYEMAGQPPQAPPSPPPVQSSGSSRAIPLPTQELDDPSRAPSVTAPPAPEAPAEPSPAPAAPGRNRREVQGNDGPLDTAPDGTVYRTVTVRKGDTLEKLLRREGVDPDLIYRNLIKVTLSLNSNLKNPNIIVAGAQLRIPTDGGYQAGYSSPRSRTQAPDMAVTTAEQTPRAPVIAASRQVGDQRLRTPDKTPERRTNPKFTISTKRQPPAPMPTADSQNARTILGVIFTRLGETFTNKGRLFLPLDEPPHFDIDTASIPVIEMRNGHRIVLDMSRSLGVDLIKRTREKYPDYMIFQPTRGEAMEKVIERLWPMCSYYRIYNRTQSFEGGRDVKLKITADWLIWPTAEDWNRGQPVIVNFAPAPDNATPQAWVRFLANHGITVIDLYKGLALAEPNKSPTPINNFTVIEVDSQNPSAFASSLIKSFGFSPRLGIKVELTRGRIVTGGAELGPNAAPPVFWEAGPSRIVLEYGDLSSEDLEVLRRNDFKVISSGKDIQSVLKSVLAALDIKLESGLVLNGSSTGGPNIDMTISGQSFFYGGRSYLFTSVALPDNMVALDPNQNTVVLHYRAAQSQTVPSAGQGPPVSSADPPPTVIQTPPPSESGPGTAGDGQIEVTDLS